MLRSCLLAFVKSRFWKRVLYPQNKTKKQGRSTVRCKVGDGHCIHKTWRQDELACPKATARTCCVHVVTLTETVVRVVRPERIGERWRGHINGRLLEREERGKSGPQWAKVKTTDAEMNKVPLHTSILRRSSCLTLVCREQAWRIKADFVPCN